MIKVIYSETQIKELEQNAYVEKCTKKQIRFTNEFKIELLRLADSGIFYRKIFDTLGFPEYIIHSKVSERTYNIMKLYFSYITKYFSIVFFYTSSFPKSV